MVLRVYQDGSSTLEVPIVTKGRKGSWWETPAGLYKINTKENKLTTLLINPSVNPKEVPMKELISSLIR
jgi:hypothetical protein